MSKDSGSQILEGYLSYLGNLVKVQRPSLPYFRSLDLCCLLVIHLVLIYTQVWDPLP